MEDTLEQGQEQELEADRMEPLVIGDRTFHLVEEDDLVFEQYGFLQKACSDAGMIHELEQTLAPRVKAIQSGEEFSEAEEREMGERILMRAFEGRAYLDVLAGILVEEGQEWTIDYARANREFFAGMKGKENIRRLHHVIIFAILSFFVSGPASTQTSPSSSDQSLPSLGAMGGAGPELGGLRLRPKKSPSGGIASEISAT